VRAGTRPFEIPLGALIPRDVPNLLATVGGYGLRSHWLERWGNVFTALVLVVIGALVLTGAI